MIVIIDISGLFGQICFIWNSDLFICLEWVIFLFFVKKNSKRFWDVGRGNKFDFLKKY